MAICDHRSYFLRKRKSDRASAKLTRREFVRYATLLSLSSTAACQMAGLLIPRLASAVKVRSLKAVKAGTGIPKSDHRAQLSSVESADIIKPSGGPVRCLDAHVHCGLQSRRRLWTFGMYLRHVSGTPIRGAAMFAFCRQIYGRWNPDFTDSPKWRQRRRQANEYLLSIGTEDFEVFPYFFLWNDFLDRGLDERYCGIKWHRHADEPVYHYDDPRCTQTINIIRKRNLPIVYEEEIHHTIRFIRKLATHVTVILPHMGFLNGGYRAIVKHGLFERPNVYTDTSLASTGEILDYLDRYGHERILFGSDFPFGDPRTELKKILRLPISPEKREAIAGLNLQRLMSQSKD